LAQNKLEKYLLSLKEPYTTGGPPRAYISIEKR